MHSLQRHIGIALLASSFVLFTLWAIPYAGGLDAFSLSASASGSVGVAPEHEQLEVELQDLHTRYANAKTQDEITASQDVLLDTVAHLFEDENPNGELLRGDAVYLTALYAAVLGQPCEMGSVAKDMCALIGGTTEILDLEASRVHMSGLEDDKSLFGDVAKGDWYNVYVGMLVATNVLHPDLDAVSILYDVRRFEPNTPVFAADFERWLYKAQRGENPKDMKFAPGQTLTKTQGKEMLLKRLDATFAARASRR